MPSKAVRQPAERVRAGEALQLRLSGLSYVEIARKLKFKDPSGARKAVSRLLDRTEAEGVAELRAMEDERLDQLQAACWQAAISGDIDAIKASLAVHDRRVKLHGLAAPVAVEVGLGMTDVEFAEQTAALFARREISTAVRAELQASVGEMGRKLAPVPTVLPADGQTPVPEGKETAVPFHAARRAHGTESGDDGWSNIE